MAVLVVKSDLNLSSNSITNVSAPISPNDVATKAYVDGLVVGQKWKASVAAATIGPIDINEAYITSIDGVSLVQGTRVLIKDQIVDTENGIYQYDSIFLVRTSDADTENELNNAVVSITSVSININKTYRQTETIGTIGTDSIKWEIFGAIVTSASTTQTGTIEIATQEEVDAGLSPFLAVTPLTLAASRIHAYEPVTKVFSNVNVVNVVHNRGRIPTVSVYTTGGVQMFTSVIQLDLNRFMVEFSNYESGYIVYQ